MIKVYFESNSHAELVATFESEDLYIVSLPALEKKAKEQGMIVTEVDEEQEWETECEHKQEVDLGIHDDYLDRCN
jgi:hypothetical protein